MPILFRHLYLASILIGCAGFAGANPDILTQPRNGNFCADGDDFNVRIILDDNDDRVSQATFRILWPDDDFRYLGADNGPDHDGSVSVRILSDDDDDARIEVTVAPSLLFESFEEGVLVELEFEARRNLTRNSRIEIDSPRVTTSRETLTPDIKDGATDPLVCQIATPSPSPSPTATPSPSPTISPSPTPAPGETIYFNSFDGTQPPWQCLSATEGGFDPVLFSSTPGALAISPNGSSNAFGFCKSPRIPVVGGQQLLITYRVRSNTSSQLCPQFRIRVNEAGFRHSQFLAIESTNAGISPDAGGRDYRMVYLVPDLATEIELSFDLASFNPDDDLAATVELLEVRVERQ